MQPAQTRGATEPPLLEETIGGFFERTVARFPDREALVVVHQDIRWSWRRLNEEVDRLACGLLARGLDIGDRVGIWSPNHAEWVLAQFATAKLGLILVNINPAYRASELAYALKQSGCRLLIAARSFKTSDYVKMLGEVRGACPALEQVVFLDEGGAGGDSGLRAQAESRDRSERSEATSWTKLLADGERVPRAEIARRMAQLKPGDPINIQYTSGTTGAPKGATLSHRNILNNAYFTGGLMSFTERDRFCIPVPFYHCAGMVVGNLTAVTCGGAMVIPAPSFEPAATLRAIEQERCTALGAVPTMHIAMLAHPDFAKTDVSSLRTGFIGGAPCPLEVMKRLVTEFHMPEVAIVYGMTETSPVSTQSAKDDPIDKRVGTVGRVHPHVEIRIFDPATEQVCARGETGEFQTRGYSVMLGYWNDEARTREAITPDGWMRTGDLASMDAEGYVNIVGRLKDMIIRGGENIYPREIEEFLYTHPHVRDVQVIGVPDAHFGEEVMACVVLKEGASPLNAEQLRAFCRDKIAHHKIPRYVRVVSGFPMTVTGKVRKVEMRAEAIELLGLQQAAAQKTA